MRSADDGSGSFASPVSAAQTKLRCNRRFEGRRIIRSSRFFSTIVRLGLIVINVKYRQLKAFTLVVETGSFKAAAEQLAVAPPSFSALIKGLEIDLGMTLFERTTRKCVTSDAGRAFYERVRGTLGQLEEAYRDAREAGAGRRGKLALAALPSLCQGVVTRTLARFQKRYPQVRISLIERRHHEVLEGVRRGDVEVGVGSMPEADKELTFQPLFTDQLMIVAPKGHPLLRLRPVWKSLEKCCLITIPAGPVERALRVNRVRVVPALEVEHTSTALAMVREGMGVTVLPSSMLGSLNTEGLTFRQIDGKLSTRQLGLIHRTQVAPSAAVQAFAALIRAETAAPLEED